MPRKKEQYAVIYKIISPTGGIYIGQTINYKDRVCAYKRAACKKQSRLYASIISHGWENHKIEILEQLPKNITILNEREIYWIAFYKCNHRRYPLNHGLNLNDGGGAIEARSGREQYQYKGDIFQICLIKGEIVGTYPNANQAATAIGIYPSKINEVLRGVRKQTSGYFFTRDGDNWQYERQKLVQNTAKNRGDYYDSISLKVDAYSPDGTLYKTFNSVIKAANHFDVKDARSIKENIAYNSVNVKRKLLWGHVWRYNADK